MSIQGHLAHEAVERKLASHRLWLEGAAEGQPASFAHTNLFGSDFSGQDLREVDFGGADLQGVRFIGCNLTRAIFMAPISAVRRFAAPPWKKRI